MSPNVFSVEFGELRVELDANDRSAKAYSQRSWFEEYKSSFYLHVKESLNPTLLIDAGANYGVASVFMKRAMPSAALISVEPNPNLIPFLERNFSQNGLAEFKILHAVVGNKNEAEVSFHINPGGSQDSRVVGIHESWKKVFCSQVSIDSLVQPNGGQRVFIKVDCQGFEEHIFNGAARFLSESDSWLIKTEFAPEWLKSQGTDPAKFMEFLCRRFVVTEFPARYNFFTHYSKLLEQNPIHYQIAALYTDYVEGLARHNRGWVDLLVSPRQK